MLLLLPMLFPRIRPDFSRYDNSKGAANSGFLVNGAAAVVENHGVNNGAGMSNVANGLIVTDGVGNSAVLFNGARATEVNTVCDHFSLLTK